MSDSISYATPALLGKQRRVVLRDTLGVLTLHEGRLGLLGRHNKMLLECDLSAIAVTPKGRGADPTAFVVSLDDGVRWSCAFWFRNTQYTPIYLRTNYVDVPIEEIDLTDKWQAQDTCASWLRIFADPTAPEPKAWHPG